MRWTDFIRLKNGLLLSIYEIEELIMPSVQAAGGNIALRTMKGVLITNAISPCVSGNASRVTSAAVNFPCTGGKAAWETLVAKSVMLLAQEYLCMRSVCNCICISCTSRFNFIQKTLPIVTLCQSYPHLLIIFEILC